MTVGKTGHMTLPKFPATSLSQAELQLQAEVREFLAAELPKGSYRPSLTPTTTKNRSFTQRLNERGWVGMALPAAYGGGERSAVERFVVVEELLRWGAPIGYHWTADRQTGPIIARHGTAVQKSRFLPLAARGELSVAVGMSEPDSGSDLASVRTSAERVPGGWRVNGTKIWTTGAHDSDWLVTLCRTSRADDPRQGLTQLIIPIADPGVTVSPIPFLDGTHDFNTVHLQDVIVPDDLVLGEVGAAGRRMALNWYMSAAVQSGG